MWQPHFVPVQLLQDGGHVDHVRVGKHDTWARLFTREERGSGDCQEPQQDEPTGNPEHQLVNS